MSGFSLKKIARELNLKSRYNILYGNVNGYIVSISRNDNAVELFIDSRLVDLPKKISDELETFMSENLAPYGISDYSISKTGLSINVNDKKENISNIIEFLYCIINELKVLGILGTELCSNCGKTIEEGVLVKVGAHAHICDEECANKLACSKRTFRSKTKLHFFAGLIGAIMGSIVALAPWGYLSYFGYYSAPATILIPLLAALGYKIFGGKNCVGKAVCVTVLSFINYALAVGGLVYYKVFKEWRDGGYIFTRSELVSTLLSSFTQRSEIIDKFLYYQIIAGGIFIVLGLVIVLPRAFRAREKYTAIL